MRSWAPVLQLRNSFVPESKVTKQFPDTFPPKENEIGSFKV